MYNTPSTRTSKNATSRKRNNRKTQQYQHDSQVLVTTLPDRDPMYPPPPPMPPPPLLEGSLVDDDEKYGFVIDSPQLGLVHIRDEDELGASAVDERALEDVSADETGPDADGDLVDLEFNPFAVIGNNLATKQTPEELTNAIMPQPEPRRSATPSSNDDNDEPAERPGPRFSALSDAMEVVHTGEPMRVQEQTSEVTSLNSPPASPPPSSGRTRAPILVSRHPTSPSSLSRQLHNVQALLPTSPQLGFTSPFANFAAPRISNVTVSGSSFHYPTSRPSTGPFVNAKETRRRSTGNSGESRDRDRARLRMTPHSSKSSESDEEDDMPPPSVAKHTRYPTSSVGSDKVIFASFAALAFPSPSSPARRLLFVGYENGLQIWDTTHLGEVREVLNRRLSGAVVGCSVLPTPRSSSHRGSVEDRFAQLRPLLGIVIEEHDASYLLVYSLVTHDIVKKLDFSGATITSVQASNSFTVVATSSPFSLHILCSRTLNILHTIQSRQLYIFSRPVSLHTPEGTVETVYSARQDRPHAVFALSSRLLAFASVPHSAESPSSLTNLYPRMAIPHAPSIQIGSLNVTQADIGNAAMKVGGGLLSGMKTLGGIAVAAARGERSSSASVDTGGLRKFFLRSAPTASPDTHHARSPSDNSQIGNEDRSEQGLSPTATKRDAHADATHITVLDLQPLLEDRENGRPEGLSDFTIPSGQVVAGLKFTEDGTSLSVVPGDGGTVRLYQIRPASAVLRSASLSRSVHDRNKPGTSPTRKDSTGSAESRSSSSEDSTSSMPWHIYDLRRGRTSGVIEAVSHSTDGRWAGISTRKRTIHIFATNPYGGKPDDASHTEGKVKNVDTIQSLSTEVRPIVRLRSNPVSSQEQLGIPLAFTFISSSPDSLPAKFLPPPNTFSPPSSVSSSIPSSAPHQRTQSVSPRLPSRPTNYQDILTFDPTNGSLSLRRMTISTRIAETSSFLSSLPIPTGTSISLPGIGFMGRTSASPPKSAALISAPTGMEHLQTELVAKDTTIATWNLTRDSKSNDVKEPLVIGQEMSERRVLPKSEWLAQAELSTYSRSTRIIPGSIYLSYQFSFFALSEDYHALIRRLHFDIPVDKIEVRRQVEASAYAAGQGESFVSAASTPQDARGARSFDDSLASAIHAGLEYPSSSPPIIPMLPNGARPGSFKASLPIRGVAVNLTEGVNDSLGRLSRGFRRLQSPRMRPARTDESVPLEFDEEDEAFLSDHANDNDNDTMSNSGCGGRDSHSVSTPSTSNLPLPENESEQDAGWLDDMDAVEEAERFDEISAVRLMEEEHMQQQAPIRVPQKVRHLRKGRRGF
ncbi:hypothetical protein A7U60_g3814 [Sanghuangporus baumii]|uniref:BCAS3 WD40 domain-containing protein n=1 Tax=Sanghuangporus baumii TaxID=108892 RepID=A0A9Q5HZP3_SANBA|nr:hypothetical protein A7U60_g3814 [Sanghuangporus baumii]